MSANSQKMNETKRKIIEISRDLFSKEGFENVTINEICQSAGISKHTFYYYFGSKEELLHPFCKMQAEWNAHLMSEIMKISSPLEQLWHIQSSHIKKLYEVGPEILKSVIVKHVIKDMGDVKTTIGESPLREIEITLIERAKEQGEVLNHSDCSMLRHMVLLQSISLIQYWAMKEGDYDLLNGLRCSLETTLDVCEEKRIGDYSKY